MPNNKKKTNEIATQIIISKKVIPIFDNNDVPFSLRVWMERVIAVIGYNIPDESQNRRLLFLRSQLENFVRAGYSYFLQHLSKFLEMKYCTLTTKLLIK